MTTGTTRYALMDMPSGVLPQWSPVVTTGTTSGRNRQRPRSGGAAMEPRRDDGDDIIGLVVIVGGGLAAMEPRRDDGDDSVERLKSR